MFVVCVYILCAYILCVFVVRVFVHCVFLLCVFVVCTYCVCLLCVYIVYVCCVFVLLSICHIIIYGFCFYGFYSSCILHVFFILKKEKAQYINCSWYCFMHYLSKCETSNLQLLRVLKSSFIHRNFLFNGLKVLRASRLGIVDKDASLSDQLYELLCWRLLAFLWGHSSAALSEICRLHSRVGA